VAFLAIVSHLTEPLDLHLKISNSSTTYYTGTDGE